MAGFVAFIIGYLLLCLLTIAVFALSRRRTSKENVSRQKRKLTLRQILLLCLASSLFVSAIPVGALFLSGNNPSDRLPSIETALVGSVFAILLTAYICIKYY